MVNLLQLMFACIVLNFQNFYETPEKIGFLKVFLALMHYSEFFQ